MRSKLAFLIFTFIITLTLLRGQIVKGGEINLERMSGYNFKTYVRLIINWPVSISKPYIHINWGDSSPMDSLPYVGSTCTYSGSSVLNFLGFHSFPSNGNYTITVQDDFLVGGISNIPNSTVHKLSLKHELTTTIFNSPPSFILCLHDSTYCGVDNYYYSSGSTEVDGDSISYSIANHPEILGYALPPVKVDGMSGLLSFTANTTGRYNISLKIDEWRKPTSSSPYQIIGSSYREMFVSVCNITAGLYENKVEQIRVFPNPVKDKIIIDIALNSIKSIYLTDITGKVICEYSPNSKEIDVNNISKGIYFLNLHTTHSKQVSKIIKE